MPSRAINALLLVAGAVFLLLSCGTHALSLAPFAANTCLLMFVDRLPARTGLVILFPFYVAAFCAGWFGVLPNAPLFLYAAIALVYAVPYFLPFVVHRLFQSGAAAHPLYTLVFPCAVVVVEFALSWFSPYGSWMSFAYSQDASGALGQLAAAGGIGAVTFFLAWTSSLAAWAFTSGSRTPVAIATGLAAAALLIAAAVWGGSRAVTADATGRTIAVAGILPDYKLQDAAQNAVWDDAKPAPAGAAEALRAAGDALNRDLLARSVRRAVAGSKIVAWPEGGGMVRDADEPSFLAEASAAARDNRMHLLAGYIVWHPGQQRAIENKVVVFAPDGRVAAQFHKGHPIVGFEDARTTLGSPAPAIIDTPYGRIALAICHDLDLPLFVRAAIDARADLLVAPSNDWTEIGDLHANMHRFRAVEGGFGLLRPTSRGVSVVADSRGRFLSRVETYRSGSSDFAFQMPVGKTPTFYASAGDWPAWTSALILALLLLGRAMRVGRRQAT